MEISDRFLFFLKNPKEIPTYVYDGCFVMVIMKTAHKTLVRYINFEDKGMILGYGCGSPGMTKKSRYPEDAYKLGRNL